MIVVIKRGTSDAQLAEFCKIVEGVGVNTHLSKGIHTTIVGLVGDVSRVDIDTIGALPYVETVKRITEPYKNANR
ncbi:MAG: 3-deoxy-7-phosphoheptulonate synthase, partial [Acetanaerobacterium sp.]